MNESRRRGSVGRPVADAEWAAISARRSVPTFLFVVTSTGIICTPGCPARSPGRERVRVVSGLEEALAVGARPCLRCHPDRLFGAWSQAAVHPVATAIARIAQALAAGDDAPTDRELAGELRLPERRLREMFRASLGVTPRAWLAARRGGRPGGRSGGGRGSRTAGT